MLLGCPFVSRDAIAAPLENIAGPMIARPDVRTIAMQTLWSMAGAVEAGVVLDSEWTPGLDEEALTAGLVVAGSPRTVELWCEGGDDPDAAPMAVGPVVRVDTSAEVDLPALVERIAAHFV
jgi:hypothetical protein